MIEPSFNLSEIESVLKRRELGLKRYELQSNDSNNVSQGYLTFFDVVNGTKVCGKIVRSSNERDHWPLLDHENVAPLLDILDVSNNVKIYMTIHIQIKLKDIIHKEDFIYDSRCFNRKKAYAKGILSGLSYIHGKSLCLMNLSDDNIYICNDKAVITDFSFISCSRKTTSDHLKVSKLYKAPETENQEFDAITAEMWACGTLMLDLFLTHMVPWGIIDYKPRRVMEMVNKMSPELLQAANAGSVVTETDFFKLKAFLKCFFKESQFRIKAMYGCIASFLSTKLQKEELSMRVFNTNFNCDTQQTKRKCSTSAQNSLQSVIPKTDINLNNFLTNKNEHGSRSKVCFQDNGSSEELYLDSLALNWLKSKTSGSSGSNCTERDADFSTERTSSILSLKDIIENKITKNTKIYINNHCINNADNKQTGSNEKTYHHSEDKEDLSSSSKIFLNKTAKNYQITKEKRNELDMECDQSKSFKKYQDKINIENVVKAGCSKNYSCSSVRPLKTTESDFNESDFGLNHLFESRESSEKSVAEKKVSHKVLNATKTRKLNRSEDFIKYKPNSGNLIKHFSESEQEISLPPRDLSPHSNNKMPLRMIKEKFVAIRKAELSLEEHKLFFISGKLADKQKKIINEYRGLLLQEKLRLCGVLSNEYKLSKREVRIFLKLLDSNSPYNKNNSISVPEKLQYSSSEFYDYTSTDLHENEENCSKLKLRDSENRSKFISQKRLFYSKAVESSASQGRKNCDYRVDTRKDPKNNELILMQKKECKNVKNTETRNNGKKAELQIIKNSGYRLNPSLEDFVFKDKQKSNKELSTGRKHGKGGKKDIKIPLKKNKTHRRRKLLCFSLCPRGKVESSSSDDLCEACKSAYGLKK